MTRDNFQHVLQKMNQRKPFHPFTLELVSGSKLEVNHPEALTLYEHVIAYVSSRGVRSFFEYGSVVRFIDSTGTV